MLKSIPAHIRHCGPKGGFPLMAKITRILAGNICRQRFFVINTAASTRCLVENFQLICHSQRVNTRHNTTTVVVQDVQMAERSDGCSGETLLAPCTRKKRMQRKMTKDYYWAGVQENVGMSSKS